jgi:hypothetical protein
MGTATKIAGTMINALKRNPSIAPASMPKIVDMTMAAPFEKGNFR